jgi:hypothetical protein
MIPNQIMKLPSFLKRLPILASLLWLAPAFARATPPTRAEVIRIAESYANYRWLPTQKNVLHGRDSAGIVVDTPDRSSGNPDLWQPGEASVGVPYKWGGFDSLESFERGLKTGKAAGDRYSEDKRRLGGKAVSAFAAGA